MNRDIAILTTIFLLFLQGVLSSLHSQTDLNASGEIVRIDFSGSFVDYTIPQTLDPEENLLVFKLRGGDGGRIVEGNTSKKGGGGATIQASFEIKPGRLEPGGTIRFIVGKKGDNNSCSNCELGGGGGGGTAVLYLPPGASDPDTIVNTLFVPDGSKWILLAAAGGGGGASGYGTPDGINYYNGGNGEAGECGGTGRGGCDGEGGLEYVDAGGGGGAFFDGQGTAGSHGHKGGVTGGSGGSPSGNKRAGGYGFGGGGSGRAAGRAGGGGGGGYSGGGGGWVDKRSGGGGSFVLDVAFTSKRKKGEPDGSPEDGFITYFITDASPDVEAPVANCRDTTIRLPGTETVSISPEALDDPANPSYDPNNLPLDFAISTFVGGEEVELSGDLQLDCNDLNNPIDWFLKVSNGVQVSYCPVTIDLEPGDPGTLTCPSDIVALVNQGDCYDLLSNELLPLVRPFCDDSLTYQIINPQGEVDSFPTVWNPVQPFLMDSFTVGKSMVTWTSHYEDSEGIPVTQSCSFTVTMTNPISLSCPPDITVALDDGDCSMVVQGSELLPNLDGEQCADFRYEIIPAGENPVIISGSDPTDLFLNRIFDAGLNTVNYQLINPGLDTLTCSFAVDLIIDEQPGVQCQSGTIDIELTSDLDSFGIMDAITTQVSTTCDIYFRELSNYSLDCALIGQVQENVLMTVYNASRNENEINFCEADIRLVDNTAPVAQCITQPLEVELDSSGAASILPEDIDLGSTDFCMPFLSLDIAQFSCLDLGMDRLVVLTVTDSEQNSDTCHAMVRVVDKIGPVTSCENLRDTVYLDANGEVTYDLADLATYIDDNCALNTENFDIVDCAGGSCTSFTGRYIPWDCSRVGTDTVFFLPSDVSGNFSSSPYCAVVVTVLDTVVPVLSCPSVQVDLDKFGVGILEADQAVNLTDNCMEAGFELSFSGDFSTTLRSFDCNDALGGPINIEVYGRDASGNAGHCLVQVTVADPSGECFCDDDDLTIVDDPIPSGIYRASNTITATGQVAADSVVRFIAGNAITFGTGFLVETGVDFNAFIDDCPSVPAANGNEPVVVKETVAESWMNSVSNDIDLQMNLNPLREKVNFTLDLPRQAQFSFFIKELTGRPVRTIADGKMMPAGLHQMEIDLSGIPPGIYQAIWQVGDRVITRKVVKISN